MCRLGIMKASDTQQVQQDSERGRAAKLDSVASYRCLFTVFLPITSVSTANVQTINCIPLGSQGVFIFANPRWQAANSQMCNQANTQTSNMMGITSGTEMDRVRYKRGCKRNMADTSTRVGQLKTITVSMALSVKTTGNRKASSADTTTNQK